MEYWNDAAQQPPVGGDLRFTDHDQTLRINHSPFNCHSGLIVVLLSYKCQDWPSNGIPTMQRLQLTTDGCRFSTEDRQAATDNPFTDTDLPSLARSTALGAGSSAGTGAFIALRVPAGYLTCARTRLLSAGTPYAINAVFTSDIKCADAMTYEAVA